MERTTIAILIKLILIKRVASNLFGEATSFNIFSSFFFPDIFNSSISVGVSEKKADSPADTNDTTTSKTSMDKMDTSIPAEKG